jgi:hypothetical protein
MASPSNAQGDMNHYTIIPTSDARLPDQYRRKLQYYPLSIDLQHS